MTHEETKLYLALRKEGKIGKLFGSENEGWKLAPPEALKWLEHKSATCISEVHLAELVKNLAQKEFGYVERKQIRNV